MSTPIPVVHDAHGEPVPIPLAWDRDHVVVTDDAILPRLSREYLSPSSSSAIASCPARYAIDRLLPSADSPLDPGPLGTGVHAVLENFMALPADLRSKAALAEKVTEHIDAVRDADADKGWPGLAGMEDEYRSFVAASATNIFRMEDPSQVVVTALEEGVSGTAFGVPFYGIIDRQDVVRLENGRVGAWVVDYKSGKFKPEPKEPHYDDSVGDQMRIYTEVLRDRDGVAPLGASLYFTTAAQERIVPLTSSRMKRTAAKFQRSWDVMQDIGRTGRLSRRASGLCGYCPLVKACPTAAASRWNEPKVEMPDVVLPTVGALIAVALPEGDDAPESEPDFDAMFAGDPSLMDETDLGASDDVDACEGVSPLVDETDLGASDDVGANEGVPCDRHAVPALDGVVGGDAVDSADIGDQEVGAVASGKTVGSKAPPARSNARGKDRARFRVTMIDGKPWEEIGGPDDTLNAASYATTAAFTFVITAVEKLVEAGIEPTDERVNGVARLLSIVVSRSQEYFTNATSMADSMNSRMRHAMHCVLRTMPLPLDEGTTPADVQAWAVAAITRMQTIGTQAYELWNDMYDSPGNTFAKETFARVAASLDESADAA